MCSYITEDTAGICLSDRSVRCVIGDLLVCCVMGDVSVCYVTGDVSEEHRGCVCVCMQT